MPQQVTPEPWIQLVSDRVLTPYTKPEQVVIDKDTAQAFELLDSRARAHALAKGEHEAMLYLHLYAIWNSSLWRAVYDTWEDYCNEWDKMPFGVSKSSIKHKVSDIKRLLAIGVTPDGIVKALGNVPMATRKLLDEVVEEHDGQIVVTKEFYENVPMGLSANDYFQQLADLGAIQAGIAVDELLKRPRMWTEIVDYDELSQRILFKIISDHPVTGKLTYDGVVPDVPKWVAKYLVGRIWH